MRALTVGEVTAVREVVGAETASVVGGACQSEDGLGHKVLVYKHGSTERK